MCNEYMARLSPTASNTAYQHDTANSLARRKSSGSYSSHKHRRLESDSALQRKLRESRRLGQHEQQTWVTVPVNMSPAARHKIIPKTSLGFVTFNDLEPLERSQSTSIPYHNDKSIENSLNSSHTPPEPRVIWSPVPHTSHISKIDADKPVHQNAETSKSLLQTENVRMAGIEPSSKDQWPASLALPSQPGPKPNTKLDFPELVEQQHPRSEQGGFDKDWLKIKRLRIDVWSLRAKIHERRGILREKQLYKGVADDNYLKQLWSITRNLKSISLGGSVEHQDLINEAVALDGLLRECSEARDLYGPLEDDCNLLEDRLSAQEFELQKLEENFPERRLLTIQLDTNMAPRDSPSLSSDSGSEMGQEYHPLVAEYLSKVGDLEILRERLDYHEEEKFNLEEEQETKRRVNLDLADDDQEWLDNYATTKSKLLDEFVQAEAEVETMKQKCLSRGLIDEDCTPTDFERREQKTFAGDLDINAGSETSEYVKFPLLIPEPGSQKTHVHDSNLDLDETSHDSSLRVDKWLLNQLRMSPLQVNLLARIYALKFGTITEAERWQIDVLKFWYSDGTRITGLGPDASTGEIAKAPRETGYASTVPTENSQGLLFGTTIRKPMPHPERPEISEIGANESDHSGINLAAPHSKSLIRDL